MIMVMQGNERLENFDRRDGGGRGVLRCRQGFMVTICDLQGGEGGSDVWNL
jgi:hypothetical protein